MLFRFFRIFLGFLEFNLDGFSGIEFWSDWVKLFFFLDFFSDRCRFSMILEVSGLVRFLILVSVLVCSFVER